MIRAIYIVLSLMMLVSCSTDGDDTPIVNFELLSVKVGTLELEANTSEIPIDQPLVFRFNLAVDRQSMPEAITITVNNVPINLVASYLDNDHTISLLPENAFTYNTNYTLTMSNLKSIDGQVLDPQVFTFVTTPDTFGLNTILIGNQDLDVSSRVQNVTTDALITVDFNKALSSAINFDAAISLQDNFGVSQGLGFSLNTSGTLLTIAASVPLQYISEYTLTISMDLISQDQSIFEGFSGSFYTMIDSEPKFPVISTEGLLTKIQAQTFKYFWDFGHPNSGLSRERNSSGDLVTSGGSGFGLMALIVGIERGFITRAEGVDRVATVVEFLSQADRFHGAWSHWLNGETGEVIPFSEFDNGGDLVETSYLVQGLLTVRQYLDPNEAVEDALIEDINELWQSVEWDWYTQGGQNQLFWHYSNDFEWQMNLPIRGYNEALITYVLAASSPDHAISPEVYHEGWAKSGGISNGTPYFNLTLPLGPPLGGPLFFSHYSFLGLDPRNLSDTYANYWEQNVNHSLINYNYCISNPLDYVGYDNNCWGLTASDNRSGYSAHSPTNDLGVITPTAAISSLPYTTDESLLAIEHFYYLLGDKTWGEYGFYDAFSLTESWVADSYLAIDQGPIIIMIENHRTGLLWDLFMSCPEVQTGLDQLSFSY